MTFHALNPSRLRLKLAAMTALAGGGVSLAMVHVGGPLAQHLPAGEGFHLAAVAGAWLAGLCCADGFGRPRRRGFLLAAVVAVVATVVGAVIGSTLMGLFAGTVLGYGMGLIALIDATNSTAALAFWGASMAILHLAARRLRQAAVTNP